MKKNHQTEVFKPSIYDTLLVNNQTTRIDNLFKSYLIIGSDERSREFFC